MAPADRAVLCGVMGLQGESAEPTAGAWFNLLVVAVLKMKITEERTFQSFYFAFSSFQGPVPSSVCYCKIVP